MSECLNQIPFCKVKCCECDCKGREETCPYHKVDCGGESSPSFKQWRVLLKELLEQRHLQTDTLDKTARNSILATLEEFRTVMGYSEEDKVSVINRKSIAEYVSRLKNIKGISRKSKAWKLMQCFSRWIRYAVEDKWTLPVITMPEIADDFQRFKEPSPEVILKIGLWFRSLLGRGNGTRKNRDRLFCCFMIHYSLRNNDVWRLKWSNIKMVDGKPRLEYTPHKTRLTSKREVKVWMNAMDYYDLMEYKKRLEDAGYSCGPDDHIMGGGKCTSLQQRLNKEMSTLGLPGLKKLYICRALCIHAVMKEFGKERAEAISGDDYKTLSTHYLDVGAIDIRPPSCFCI